MSINDYFQTGEVKPKAKNTSGGINNYFKDNTSRTVVQEQTKTPKQVQVETSVLSKPKTSEVKIEQPTNKTDGLSFWDKYKKFAERGGELSAKFDIGIIRTTGSLLGGLSTIGKKINPLDKALNKAMGVAVENEQDDIGVVMNKFADTLKKNVTKDEENYLDYVAEGLGSSVPFLAGGVVGSIAKVPPLLLNLGISGSEALINAYDDYTAIKSKGGNETNASLKALASFGSNITLNFLTNKLGWLGKLDTPASTYIGAIKNFLLSGFLESGQETSQQIISNIVQGQDIRENLKETFLISLPISAVFGGMGAGSNILTIKDNAKKIKNLKKVYDDLSESGDSRQEIEKKVAEVIGVTQDEMKKQFDYVFERTSSEIRNEIIELQKDPVANQQNIIDLQVAQREFYDMGSSEAFTIIGIDNTPTVVVKTFEYSDNKYAVQIEASTPNSGLNTSFETSKLYDTEKQAIAESKKEILAWANDSIKRSQSSEDITALNNIIENITKPQKMVKNKVDKEQTEKVSREIAVTLKEMTPEQYIGYYENTHENPSFNGFVHFMSVNRPKFTQTEGINAYTTKYPEENKQEKNKEKTQKEKVKDVIKEKAKSIKEIAKETKIKEPNVRRILGVGAKEGTFERVEQGVYKLSKDGEDLAYIETGNAVESLPRLVKEGFKADMVFLDIPYDTPAVKGGNRGANYDLLSVQDFDKVLESVAKIVKTTNSPVIHMFSNAESGLKAMQKYNNLFEKHDFKVVGKGFYQKTYKDGSPVAFPTIHGSKVTPPEGILVFTLSGKLNKDLENLNFTVVRPKGYQTEKSAEMLEKLIKMTTEEGDMVFDPFAGSGVTGAEAVKAGRKSYNIEKNPEVVEKYTKPRIKEAVEGKTDGKKVLPSSKKKAETENTTPEGWTSSALDTIWSKNTNSPENGYINIYALDDNAENKGTFRIGLETKSKKSKMVKNSDGTDMLFNSLEKAIEYVDNEILGKKESGTEARELTEEEVMIPEKKRYYISVLENGKYRWQVVKAEPVSVDPSITTFVFRDGKDYVVSELTTGQRLNTGKTVEEAISKSKESIKNQNEYAKDFAQLLKEAREKFGMEQPYSTYFKDKQEISSKTTKILQTTRATQGLSLAPSTQKTAKGMELELESIFGKDANKIPNAKMSKGFVTPTPLVKKSDIKEIIENSPEFKKDPVLIVDADKNLTFTSPRTSFKIKADALNLYKDGLQEGDKITVDIASLKETGTQQMRVFKDGQPMYQRRKEDTERFLSQPEVRAELAKYFDDGELAITFADRITMEDGGEAWGKYEKGMVEFVNNPLAETPTHEAVHAFLDLFVSPEQKSRYIAEALKQKQNKIGLAELNKQVSELHKQYGGKYSRERIKQMYGEELLADGFVEHRFRRNAKGILRTWYDKIIAFLRKIFKRNSANKLYDDIVSKRRDYIKRDFNNQKQIIKYQDISVAEQAKNALAVIKKQRQLTSKFFESPNIKGKESTSYTYLKDLSKSTGLGLKGVEQKIIQEVLETPQFKDKKIINLNDFKNEVIGNMLPLSIIKTNTYAGYGADRIGLSSSNGNFNNETYLFNSDFEHGVTGHFSQDFGRTLKKEDIEIKEIPPQQGNPTSKFAVIKKGVTLTEQNIEENVFNVSDTKAEAEKWVDLHVVNDNYKGTANETVEVNKRGLFGHARTFDDFDATENVVSHIAEIQSDVFQHLEKVPTSNREIIAKKKDIEIINVRIESLNKRLDDAKNNDFIEGDVRDSLAYKARIKEIKDEIARQEKNKSNLEKEISEIKPLAPMPFEERFLEYKNIWHERIVREMIHMKANEGFDYLRFPTPRTIALIEGYTSDNQDNLMPYELTGGQTREDTLTFGDEINYGGETMTVLSDDPYSITVAPSDAVSHFDYDDAMTEDIEGRWNDEIEWEFTQNGGLYKDFGEITTAEKAQEVLDQIKIYNKQVEYNTIEKRIKNLKERDSSSSSRKFSLDRIESAKKMIADLERERNALTLDLIKKSGIVDILKQNGGFSIYELIDKFGQNNTFWRYIIDSYNGMDNPTPKKIFDDVKKGLEEQIKDQETILAEHEKSIIEADERLKKDIEEVKATKAVPANKLKLLPEKLQKDVKTADWEYGLDYNAEKILEKMAEKDPEETFEIGDFRDDFVSEMAESYDPDFEGMYGQDHVFIQDKGYGNQEVWVVDEGSYTETFDQPDQYEEAKSIEDFNIDDFEGNELTVLKFYDQQVNKYVAKLRKDNLELVTDGNGYQWLETKLTDADKEAPTAYMSKKPEDMEKQLDDSIENLKPIEMPELVRLARNLTGSYPKIKEKMGNKRGYFKGEDGGIIAIKADLFKTGNEEQVAKTLAHEIGHLADWLPDKTLSRGNLLGRIFGLRKFMSSTFDKGLDTSLNLDVIRNQAFKEILAEKGIKYGEYLTNKTLRNELKPIIKARYNEKIDETKAIKNPVVDEELTRVTEFWRPYDKETSPKNYIKYRNSSAEKYADAVSMLFNQPALLQEMAPTFYTEFFGALDRKPEVKAEYFETQELLRGSTEELFKARKEDIRSGFERGEDLQKEFSIRKKVANIRFMEKIRQQIDDINYPILKKQAQIQAKGGTISEADDVKYALQEESFVDNENFLLVDNIQKTITDPIENAGMTVEDFGEYLMLDRIRKDRADIANPFGFNQKNANEQIDFLKSQVGEENFALLEKSAKMFHDMVFKSVEEAVRVGSYNKKTFEEKILPNKDSYASFQVVDYMQDYIPATIKGQTGTLKEIANPFISTILKTIALNRLNAYQRSKNATIKLLETNFPDEIAPSKKITSDGKLTVFKVAKDRGGLEVLVDGKLTSYDVDPYIAERFKKDKVGDLQIVADFLRIPNNVVLKPLFTTFNLGFSLFMNPSRDFRRNYKVIGAQIDTLKKSNKDIKSLTVLGLLKAYAQSLPSAVRFTKGELDNFTRELVEMKAINAPINDWSYDPRDDEFGRILEKYNLIKPEEKAITNIGKVRKVLLKPVNGLLDGMRFVSNTLEVLSKIAGAKARINAGEKGKELAYNLRNYTGTPNYKVKGGATYITNEVFLFSNIMKEGIKSDYRIATEPNTRSGYWWRTVKIDFLPKLLMYMAGAGLAGELLKKFFENVSEYDKTNYIIIPLGWYEADKKSFAMLGRGEYNSDGKKAVYMRIPHDETGRMLSAILWKTMNFAENKELKDVQDIVSITGGMLPSITPAIEIPRAWGKVYIANQNPVDTFRGRTIIDDTTWKAGGLPVLQKMVKWTTNSMGLTKFATYDTSKNTGLETFVQTAPFFSNVIKISDYGQQERLKEISAGATKEQARQTLKDRELVSKYVKMARDNRSILFASTKYKKDIIKEALGGRMPKTAEEQEYADNLMIKFKRGLKYGANDDPRVTVLIGATNLEKRKIMAEIKKDMTQNEYNKFVKGLVLDGIISSDLAFSVR